MKENYKEDKQIDLEDLEEDKQIDVSCRLIKKNEVFY